MYSASSWKYYIPVPPERHQKGLCDAPLVDMTQRSVRSSELLLVGSFIVLLAALFLVAQCRSSLMHAQLQVHSDQIIKPVVVAISGAVLKPGDYKVPQGTSIQDVIKKSRPKQFADLSGFEHAQSVQKNMTIFVAELSTIHVHVQGAVLEEMELDLPIGTRLCDLKSKIHLSKDSDRNFLRRRRLLKNGEVILIPTQIKNDRKLGSSRGKCRL